MRAGGAAVAALCFGLVLLCGAAGCTSRLDAARGVAAEIASRGGLEERVFYGGGFRLQGWRRRGQARDSILAVYLEGDGRAWIDRGRLATDPTPTDPVGLRLAAADPAPALLYLARPCQYLGAAAPPCAPRYWSEARFAPEIVAATAAAIDRAKAEAGAAELELIGYSGGGVLATLIAAERHDVARLVTVAAPLDLGAWTRLEAVSPLSQSLDPVRFAAALARIPQTHFAGAKDGIVPPALADSYRRRLGDRAPARIIVVPGFTHDCCWARDWPRLIAAARESGRDRGSAASR